MKLSQGRVRAGWTFAAGSLFGALGLIGLLGSFGVLGAKDEGSRPQREAARQTARVAGGPEASTAVEREQSTSGLQPAEINQATLDLQLDDVRSPELLEPAF